MQRMQLGSDNQAQGRLDCTRKGYGRRMEYGDSGSARRIDLQPHRGLSDDEKRRAQKEWKKGTGYGRRWLVEIVFSAFKKMFGEHLHSLKWKNMVQEVRIKVAMCSKLVDMEAGVV